jgi:LysR family transcriptional regulator, salicylic acid-responsive activator of bsdBCD
MAIAEEHQITAAAKKLHIAQPPLSYELSQLEQELGVQLVKRGARSAELTDAGILLYKRAEQILAMTTTTTHEVQNYGKGMKGVLSIGAISSSGGLLPNKRMLDFTTHYPDIRFELHEGNTFAIIDMLEQGIIDIGIVRTPFSDEKYNCRYAVQEPMTAVMTEKYVHDATAKITLNELGELPLILYRRYESLIHEVFSGEGMKPFIACINDDARTTYIWAEKGFGVGILPKSILQVLNPINLICKDIDCTALCTKIAVIWKKERYLSPLAQKFISFFDEMASFDGDPVNSAQNLSNSCTGSGFE